MFDKSKISSRIEKKKKKRIEPNFKRIHIVAFRLFSNIKSIQIQVSTIQFASNSKKHRCLSTANSTFHSRDELGFIQSGRNSARKWLSSPPLFLLLRSIEWFKNRGIKEKKVDPLPRIVSTFGKCHSRGNWLVERILCVTAKMRFSSASQRFQRTIDRQFLQRGVPGMWGTKERLDWTR